MEIGRNPAASPLWRSPPVLAGRCREEFAWR